MEIKDAIKLASDLMEEHGLFLKGWDLKLNNAKRRKGVAVWSGAGNYIGLSRHAIATRSYEQVRQIILHEIAHALLPLDANHGPKWKAKAREIGYTGGVTAERSEVEALEHEEKIRKGDTARAKAAARYRIRKTGQVETPPIRVGASIYYEGFEWEIYDVKRVWCSASKTIGNSPAQRMKFRITHVQDLVIA